MIRVNVQDAKTHLSKYLEQVEKGETILLCRRNVPIAEIRRLPPPEPPKQPRELGLSPGQAAILPGFWDDLPEDELRLYEGESDAADPLTPGWKPPS